jgi:hypothetical protein
MYLRTVEWLQGANNVDALLIKGMGDICSRRPGGAALMAQSEEGNLPAYLHVRRRQVLQVWVSLRMYSTTSDGCMVSPRASVWRSEDGGHVQRVCHRVLEEIGRVMWRGHIIYEYVHEVHMPPDSHQCLWNRGCGNPPWHPELCSERYRLISELFDFLYRFPLIQAIVDEIDT